MSERKCTSKVDVPAIVGQFLRDASLEDLIVELIQNERDAGSSSTTILFGDDRLTCEGNGMPVDHDGWPRLECTLGAGGDVRPKVGGIGSKNHGLRVGFLLGDNIAVQSAGSRIDLTVRAKPNSNTISPAVWERICDPSAPERGTRITIPYRTKPLDVPIGERYLLGAITVDAIDRLYLHACDELPRRLIGILPAGASSSYTLTIASGCSNITMQFQCHRRTGRSRVVGAVLSRRTCRVLRVGTAPELRVEEIAIPFRLHLPTDDKANVPRFFRRKRGVFGEISWDVGRGGRLMPGTGKLRYPIGYPDTSAAFSDHGFHISGPFVSDVSRHGIAPSAVRNQVIVDEARAAFTRALRSELLPRYGPSALALIRRQDRPNTAVELDVLSRAVNVGALPVVRIHHGRTLTRRPTVDTSQEDWRVTIASFSWSPDIIEPSLIRLPDSESGFLDERSPRFVVSSLLQLFRSGPQKRLRIISESDALARVLPKDAVDELRRKANTPTAQEFDHLSRALDIVDHCVKQGHLSRDSENRLLTSGLLPTQAGPEQPWRAIYFSRDVNPSIPGVMAPSTIDLRLTHLRMLREGRLKLRVFKMDEYLKLPDFNPTGPAPRQSFFDWLRANHASLKPDTLRTIAQYPIWPGEDGTYRPLSAYCVPKYGQLRRVLRKALLQPAPTILSFAAVKRSERASLLLRSLPTEAELQNWYNNARQEVDRCASREDGAGLDLTVGQLENDLEILMRSNRLQQIMQRVAAQHVSLHQSGALITVRHAHIATQAVQACCLLPADVLSGAHHDLYVLFGGQEKPSADAIKRALLEDVRAGDIFYRRLEGYLAAGGQLEDLSSESIIGVGGIPRTPCTLTLPATVDHWGDWKIVWNERDISPDRDRLIEKLGIVRHKLTEGLSQGFFEWLSSSPTDVQREHLPQIMRHLRDAGRGPLKWWQYRSKLACLPVSGQNGRFRLVSHAEAVSPRSRVYLPDFPETHERLLARDPVRELVITDVEGISGTVLSALRGAGVRSLRKEFVPPVAVRPLSDEHDAPDDLNAVLEFIRSERMFEELPKRLEVYEVQASDLRSNWRALVRQLGCIRIAGGLTATYNLGGRNYDLSVASGVDTSTNIVWLSDSGNWTLQLFEAIAGHIMTVHAGPLAPAGLMFAIERPFASMARPDVKRTLQARQGGREQESPTANPGEEEPTNLHRSHGLSHEDLIPLVPVPTPFDTTPITSRRTNGGIGADRRPRRPASTAPLRNTTEENEQKEQLKEGHYACHCQACLGSYEVTAMTQSATMAAAKPDAAPIPSDQRGPKWFATQPTMGAPIDAPPSPTPTRIAITRPRMVGLVESCIMLFVAIVKVSVAAPITARVAANHQYPGENAASVQPIPKTPEPRSSVPNCGLSRPAANSAPLIVPIAMIDDRKPNPRASA